MPGSQTYATGVYSAKNIFGVGLMLNVLILRLIRGLEMAVFEPKIVFLGLVSCGHFVYVYLLPK